MATYTLADIFSIYVLVEAIWLILPAYAANGLIPLVGKFAKTHPIDGGRTFRKYPLFGKGKSWEGLVFGAFVGMVIGMVEMLAFPYLPWDMSPVALIIIPMGPLLGLLLGLGAGLGDLVGSFIKRRFNLARGKPAPLLDQEDFLVGSLLMASLVVTVALSWWVMLLVITPLIHWASNLCAYLLKVKKEPW
jgi:CDP-2,3-bis-(O-geranylgeranyl)-sn-glycerol synthase